MFKSLYDQNSNQKRQTESNLPRVPPFSGTSWRNLNLTQEIIQRDKVLGMCNPSWFCSLLFSVVDDKGERVPTDVKDKDDGTYEIKFTAHRPGTYCLKVRLYFASSFNSAKIP